MTKPTTHQGNLAKLPRALAPLIERDQWCVWRWIQKPDGSWQKPPYIAMQPDRHASTSDPNTWADYTTALVTVQTGHAEGLTYVLTADDPFAAIDLDHCRDQLGSIDVWAQLFLERGRNTYSEVTPSGAGCRIWGLANGEKLHRKFDLMIDGKPIAAELFRRTNKALTITGSKLDTLRELTSIDHVLDWGVIWGERRKAAAAPAFLNGNSFEGSGNGYSVEQIEYFVQAGAPDDANRSNLFHSIVGHYLGCGWDVESIFAHLQQFPHGIGARYIGEDRLLQEITRSASKYGIATPVVVERTRTPPEDDPELADDPELQDDPELVDEPAPQAKKPSQPAQPAEHEYDPELDDDDDLDDDDAGADPGQFAEPKPLPEGLAPVPPFDMKFLPEAWVPWIGNMAENMQCPPDYATISAFVGLGSLIGRRVSIRPKSDWNEYANLWGLFIGSPAMMKSPSMMKALAPIHRLEAEAARENEVALEAYKLNINAFKLRQKVRAELEKAALKKGKAADINADLLGCEPEEPKPVRYRTNDTSYEKLGELLIDNPNGLLIERDELISLLRHLDREEQGVARGFYMSGWSGSQSYVFDRIGRGHLHIPAVCLSVLGNTQPAQISEYVRRANLGGVGGDGLIQRFGLMVWPDVSSNFQNRDEPLSADAKDRAWNVFSRISELTETNLCAAGARRGLYDDTPYLCFDSAAHSECMGWYEDLERRLRGSGLSPALQGHFGKYRTLVPALALIYHLVEGVEGQVGLAALRKAVAFSRYLECHAHRIYGAVDLVEVTAAKAILARIRDGQLPDSFTARMIHQHRWSDLAEHAVVQAGLALLVEFDYLVAKQAPISQSGGRPKITYTVNPAVRGGA